MPRVAQAHCQIPCGIYDDDTRLKLMEEHVTTIEKSMQQIIEISAAADKNWNQLVRWVANKDEHADALTQIVTEYFLQQRIKPFDGGDAAARETYVAELSQCHEILVHAMKAKQTTDLAHVEALRGLIHDFAHSYLGEDDK
jgi:nickel superoxide dismutase